MQKEQKFPYFLAFFPLANVTAEELLQEEGLFTGTAQVPRSPAQSGYCTTTKSILLFLPPAGLRDGFLRKLHEVEESLLL